MGLPTAPASADDGDDDNDDKEEGREGNIFGVSSSELGAISSLKAQWTAKVVAANTKDLRMTLAKRTMKAKTAEDVEAFAVVCAKLKEEYNLEGPWSKRKTLDEGLEIERR